MADPKMLLLDEPAAAVAPANIGRLSQLVRRLRDERGLGSLIIDHNLSFLMQIASESLCIGAGLCGFSPRQLEQYRGATANPGTGKALTKAIAQAAEAGFDRVGGKHYKRVPRGFDAEHPRGELLKHTGLDVGTRRPLPDELFAPDAVDYCVECFREVRPVQKWLVSALK